MTLMNKNCKKIFFGLFLVTFFFQKQVVLAEQVSVSVDQTIFAFSASPESTNEIKINVRNISKQSQKMSVSVKDFTAGDSGSVVSMIDKNEQFGMKDWVSAKEQDWILEPQSNKEISLFINIPKNAPVGAHYAIANIQTFPEVDGQNFQNTIVGGQVGVYLLVNVKGEVSGSGNLKKINAPIVAGDSIPLKVDFENTGNILYIPHGEIKIDNIFTRKKTTIEAEKHFVFPGTKYSFEINWDAPSLFGAYKVQADFVDANGVSHIQQRFFLGRFFIPILVLVLFCGFIIRMKIKKIKKHKVKEPARS